MRFFYIDTENVNADTWCNCLGELRRTDVVVVVYTIHSRQIPARFIECIQRSACKFKLIEVDSGTKNALDFVLVSYLTERCISAKKSEHVIISSDRGYDAAINHLRSRFFNVRRFDFMGCSIVEQTSSTVISIT